MSARGPATLRQSSVAGGAALTAFGGAVSGLSGFLVTALVARTLGAEAAGILGVAIAVSMICTQVGKLGADTAFVHFVPRLGLFATGSANLPGLLRKWQTVLGGVGLASGIGLWLFADSLSAVLLGDSEYGAVALRIVAAGLPPAALTAMALAALRGLGDVRPLVLNDQIAKPLLRLMTIGVVLLMGGEVEAVILAWALPVWLLLPWAMLTLRRRTRDIGGSSRHVDPELSRAFRRFSGLRNASATLEIVGMNIGLLLVSSTLGATDAGIYSIATRLVLAGYLTMQAVRIAVGSQLSAALAYDSPLEAQHLHQRTSAWVVLSSWPAYLVLVVLAPEVLRLFGPQFASGWSVLTLVALGGLVSVGGGNIQTVLLMSGGAGAYLGVAVTAVVTNVVVTLATTPLLGVNGAALGFLCAAIAENAITIWLCRRRGVRHFCAPVITSYLVVLSTIGPACVLLRVLDPGPLGTMLSVFLGAALYLTVCWWKRETLALHHFSRILRRRGRTGDGRD